MTTTGTTTAANETTRGLAAVAMGVCLVFAVLAFIVGAVLLVVGLRGAYLFGNEAAQGIATADSLKVHLQQMVGAGLGVLVWLGGGLLALFARIAQAAAYRGESA